jgi:hypothetical protein
VGKGFNILDASVCRRVFDKTKALFKDGTERIAAEFAFFRFFSRFYPLNQS